MRHMQTLRRLISWLARHLFVRVQNLNQDPEAKSRPAVVVGVRGSF